MLLQIQETRYVKELTKLMVLDVAECGTSIVSVRASAQRVTSSQEEHPQDSLGRPGAGVTQGLFRTTIAWGLICNRNCV